MTRPCPQLAVGLECDRLAKIGIETHYDGFLKKIFTDAGSAAGQALNYVHIDSWEAGGQNWTATFPAEFRKRRGYDLRPWLPVPLSQDYTHSHEHRAATRDRLEIHRPAA